MSNEKSILIVKQDYVFHFLIRFGVCAVFLVLVYHLIFRPVDLLVLLINAVVMYFCFVVVTARYHMEFDMDKKQWFRYAWFLGLKLGSKRSFEYIEKLYVNKVDLVKANNYGPISMPNEFRNTVYKCFLKFDDGEKILFDEDMDKDRLLNRLKDYNKMLKTSIFDTTSHQAILVESREND